MFAVRLDVFIAQPQAADFLAKFAAEVVVADAGDDDGGVAELMAVEREVERCSARELAAIGVHVPEQFADADYGVHVELHGAGFFSKNAASPPRHSSVKRGAALAFASSSTGTA